jgi:hypothetical protein
MDIAAIFAIRVNMISPHLLGPMPEHSPSAA